MLGCVLGQIYVEFLLGVGEVGERAALGAGSVCGEVPEAMQGGRVDQDGADGDAMAAQVVDELQAGGVDIAPVDDGAARCVPTRFGRSSGDAEPMAVQHDGAGVVVGDGVTGLLVLQDHDRAGPVLPTG